MVLLVTASDLRDLYLSYATGRGADEQEARIFADVMLRADLRGHSSQGVALLPYLDELAGEGVMAFGSRLETVRQGVATALVDGGRNFGQVCAWRAMDKAVAMAEEVGVGVVSVRGGGDCGMVAAYALRAAEAGMIGIAMTTGPLLVAPWGGRKALFSTNPMSLAVPTEETAPLVVDMATSAESMGLVVRAARDGRQFDAPTVVDRDGRYRTDPRSVILDVLDRESAMAGALIPAGHKGFGMLLLVESLASLLSGERPWTEASPAGPKGRAAYYGHFLVALDPDNFIGRRELADACDRMVSVIGSSPPAVGFEGVRVHGAAAAVEESKRRQNGIPIREEEWKHIGVLAEKCGIETPRPLQPPAES